MIYFLKCLSSFLKKSIFGKGFLLRLNRTQDSASFTLSGAVGAHKPLPNHADWSESKDGHFIPAAALQRVLFWDHSVTWQVLFTVFKDTEKDRWQFSGHFVVRRNTNLWIIHLQIFECVCALSWICSSLASRNLSFSNTVTEIFTDINIRLLYFFQEKFRVWRWVSNQLLEKAVSCYCFCSFIFCFAFFFLSQFGYHIFFV